ncbi:MAG: FeoB-associated Cys-rich membrane protein [Rikenellaceae bacterium]
MTGEEIIVAIVVALCVIYVVWRLFSKRKQCNCQGCNCSDSHCNKARKFSEDKKK